MDPKEKNTTALAYMGDAVYEMCIRSYLIEEGNPNVDVLHKAAVKYVCAQGQEKALKGMMDGFLSDEETALVKRARNHKLSASKKNSKKDAMTDKHATAFEALIGWLYLSEDMERLEEVVEKAIEIIETPNTPAKKI